MCSEYMIELNYKSYHDTLLISCQNLKAFCAKMCYTLVERIDLICAAE